MTAGIVVIFAGYSVASYGVILVKGWDVPWRRWVNPLNPWTWPAKGKDMPKTPGTRLWP